MADNYEAAVNEGRLTIYNGVDGNGSGIALPSFGLPAFQGCAELQVRQTVLRTTLFKTAPVYKRGNELLHLLLRIGNSRIHISIKLRRTTRI